MVRVFRACGLVVAVLAVALPGPARAEIAVIGQDALRQLVLAGDEAAVGAALAAAHDADTAAKDEPDRERGLFNVFAETHPAIGAFTERWLNDEPDNPYAMIARGWQLYAMGWAIRGSDYGANTWPAAMQGLYDRHGAAFGLMQAAAAKLPDLVSASDGVLRLTQTLGNREVIPVELERIMAQRPNRGSLLRGMLALAPQWGGGSGQMDLLCDRYAPLITDVPYYTPQVCKIDAVFWAEFREGPELDRARQDLTQTDNPILDYARLREAVNGSGPPEQRLALLSRAKAARDLSFAEAQAFDEATAELKGGGALVEPVEMAKTIAVKLPFARTNADRDPYNSTVVRDYLATEQDNITYNHGSYDRADAISRLKILLHGVPYDAPGWRELARNVVWDVTDDERRTIGVKLSSLKAAEPYFLNAIVYSNYSLEVLKDAVMPKTRLIDDQYATNGSHVRDLSGLDQTELHTVVDCPLVAEMRLMQAVCDAQGISADECGGWQINTPVVQAHIAALKAKDTCTVAFSAPLQRLIPGPVKPDF